MVDDGRAARSAAWGVLALLFGGGALVFWLTVASPSLVALILASVASALGAAGLYMCFASLAGTWPAGRSLRRGTQVVQLPAAAPEQPAIPPPPLRVIVRGEQDGLRLRLIVVNRGDAGMFTAEVVSVLDNDGNARLGPSSWPIPWLEDGSVEPKQILFAGSRILDFACYDVGALQADLKSTHWGDHDHWWFSSLPQPIGFMYRPVRTLADVEAQRFLVTVRIIRADPPNTTDRQFAVGVNGFDLTCAQVGG